MSALSELPVQHLSQTAPEQSFLSLPKCFILTHTHPSDGMPGNQTGMILTNKVIVKKQNGKLASRRRL